MRTRSLLFVLSISCSNPPNTQPPTTKTIAQPASQVMSPASTQALQPASKEQQADLQTSRPTSTPTSEPPCRMTPPKGFVDLKEKIPELQLQIKYATADNFTGKILPGYEAPAAWLLEKPAEALARVQESLQKKNVGLVIFDAYRPQRASKAMVAWAKETKQEWVLTQGYVASKSTHNNGSTVDLGLIDLTTQQLIDMGTPFDFFGTESHTKNATGEILQNRLTLQKAMQAEGFAPYTKEWWHFGYKAPGAAALDVAYQCK